MRTLYYGRISTTDGQTSASQYADAAAQGVEAEDVFIDEGVSGYHIAPLDRAQWAIVERDLRKGGTLYVRWLDRISRRYDELHETMQRPALVQDRARTYLLSLRGALYSPHVALPFARGRPTLDLKFHAILLSINVRYGRS